MGCLPWSTLRLKGHVWRHMIGRYTPFQIDQSLASKKLAPNI